MAVLPYVAFGSRHLAAIGNAVESGTRDWFSEWCATGDWAIDSVEKHREGAVPNHLHCAWISRPETGSWLGWYVSENTKSDFVECLFSQNGARFPNDGDSLARSVVDASLRDLGSRLLLSKGAPECGVEWLGAKAADTRLSSLPTTCIVIAITLCGKATYLLLDALSAAKYIPPVEAPQKQGLPSLRAPRESLDCKFVGGRAILGSAQLALGEVMTLRVGDVIRLDQSINDETRIGLRETPVTLNGHLARYNNTKVLRVTSVEVSDN